MTGSDSSARAAGAHGGTWARAVNCDGRYGLALGAACAVLCASQLGGSAAADLLRYDRAQIAEGQWWRLLTAHIAHLDPRHAALNMLGLILLWVLFARDWSPRQWIVLLLAAALAVDGGLWFGDPSVCWYLGASGVLHGVMAAGTFAWVRRHPPVAGTMAALLVAKLAWERLAGPLPLAGRGVPVVVDAHLYGASAGFITSVLFWAARRGPGLPRQETRG